MRAAAGLYPYRPPWDGREGPIPRLVIAPGVLQLTRPDLARRERSANHRAEHHAHEVDQAAMCLAEHGSTEHAPADRGVIRSWSAGSRARMVRRLAQLDWTPLTGAGRLPAMITLTYPGDWLTVAPTAAAADGHLRQFYRRYERAWGEPLACAWKREFQRRGAPHWHAYMVPPLGAAGDHRRVKYQADLLAWEASGKAGRRPYYRAAPGDGLPFKRWLSATWADIVNHPDPEQYRRHLAAGTGVDYAEGMRSADPRRLAIYFTKHGQFRGKDYQDRPPAEWTADGASVGRFWGYRGLVPATATVDLDPAHYTQLARTLRRYARAQRTTREVRAPRARGGRARPRDDHVVGLAGALLLDAHRAGSRKVRRRARYLARGAGFVCVNDGPALAAILARYLAGCPPAALVNGAGRRPAGPLNLRQKPW